MGRSIGAVIAGAVAAVVMIAIADGIAGAIYPLPAGMDPNDRAAMTAAIGRLPASAFAIVLLGWAIGSLVGGLVAAKISGRINQATIVGVILLAAGVLNLALVPHPTWMWPGGIVAFAGGAYLGGKLAV